MKPLRFLTRAKIDNPSAYSAYDDILQEEAIEYITDLTQLLNLPSIEQDANLIFLGDKWLESVENMITQFPAQTRLYLKHDTFNGQIMVEPYQYDIVFINSYGDISYKNYSFKFRDIEIYKGKNPELDSIIETIKSYSNILFERGNNCLLEIKPTNEIITSYLTTEDQDIVFIDNHIKVPVPEPSSELRAEYSTRVQLRPIKFRT